MSRQELIAALKAAEGPSRELDAEVAEICGIRVERDHWTQYTQKWAPYIYDWMGCHKHPLPEFTSSVDAALALVEQIVESKRARMALQNAIELAAYRHGKEWAKHLPRYLCVAALEAEENGDE